jgi:lysophospholipase L1-like esterase
MTHVILCGDSIFDNSPYVQPDEPDVTTQVNALLPEDSKATRLAVDGDVTENIYRQLQSLPNDATHLFISVGGNDALGGINVFSEPVANVGEALIYVNTMRNQFETRYKEMLQHALSQQLPLTVCSVYYPRFHSQNLERVFPDGNRVNGETLQQMAMAALANFNDAIFRQAFQLKVPLIDLRVLCDEDADFANPIEPSAVGGQKIARAIVDMLDSSKGSTNKITVYA